MPGRYLRYEECVRELAKSGLLSPQEAGQALAQRRCDEGSPLQALLQSNVQEEKLLAEVAGRLGIAYARVLEVDETAIALVPANVATHYGVMPLGLRNGKLLLAVCDPFDYEKLDELRVLLGVPFEIVLSTREKITAACKKCYGLGADTAERLLAESALEVDLVSDAADQENNIDDESLAGEASVIRFVNILLTEAIRERATDIHLEPYERQLRVRYRIDGVLREVPVPPSISHFRSAVISRIKVMADLDIAEKRKPQDGRAKVRVAGEEHDLRISVLPTRFGEAVSIRVLTRATAFLPLEDLGLSDADVPRMQYLIRQPHGIVLVTGPTGSGKTTTLYAVLQKINSPERKILTVEDPIEYQLEGVTQMQVAPKAGLTFANALRHMLRHDPDVMMVGEIRDTDTAEISVRAALTGHLVFSTLHTNDAPTAVTRLLDMGVEPYLVASSVIGVVAQRLVRVICPHCKELHEPDANALLQLGVDIREKEDLTFYRGAGCQNCSGTGFRGRTAIYEIMIMAEPLCEITLERRSASEIRGTAVREGMRSLKDAGWEKVTAGITTIEELARVVQEEAFEARV